jgi:hypothetical protein
MSLTKDLIGLADAAADVASGGDPGQATAALEMIALILPDMAERARLLEGRTVPPHWRRQDWDSSAYHPNIVPLRGR